MDPVSAMLLIPMTLAMAALSLSCAARPVVAEPARPEPVPAPAVRLAPAVLAESLAARLHRSDPIEAVHTARRAIDEEEPRLRVVGARYLRRGDVLADLAMATWVEEDVRVSALGALDKGDRGHALRALPPCLADASAAVRLAAAHLAERLHDLDALPALCRALQDLVPRWADPDGPTLDLTRALARAFARLQGPPVEYALLRLAEGPSREARAIAFAGLARTGSRLSLAPLERASSDRDPALREAARGALASVRFRIGDARGGAISVARAKAGVGALSLSR